MRHKLTLLTLSLALCSTVTAGQTIKTHKNSSQKNKVLNDSSIKGYFVGVFGGVASPTKFKSALKNDYSFGFQYGYRDDNYRTEIAFNYIQNIIRPGPNGNSATYQLPNLLFNGYYDFNFKGVIVPFVGAGIGYLHGSRDGCVPSNSANCGILQVGSKFAYQGIAGIGINIKNRVRLDVRYRYLALIHSQNFAENVYEIVINFFPKGG